MLATKYYFLSILFFLQINFYGQKAFQFFYKVQGVVVNQNNEPISGVSIISNKGFAKFSSKINGEFYIELKEAGEIKFSCVGYKTKQVKGLNTAVKK